MITENNELGGKKFLSVLADGKFHQTVPDGTEGAIVREYEDREGNKKTKTELVFDSIVGMITKIEFRDADGLGKFLEITIDSDGLISLATSSSFGEDLMKKLPAIDLGEPVRLTPYSFEDKGKSRKGITVLQDDIKIDNYYYDSSSKKTLHGLPEPDGDVASFDSDDWKMYFTKVRKFLIKEIEDKLINK